MNNAFKILLALLLSFTALLCLIPVCAYENFTTYTEIDPSATITITSSKITTTGLNRNLTAGVYKDFGADYFNGDFIQYFTANVSACGESTRIGIWAMNDTTTPPRYQAGQKYLNVQVGTFGGTTYMQVWSWNGTADASNSVAISLNTNYYCTIIKATGNSTLTLNIYTDASRTSLYNSIYINYNTNEAWRYLWAYNVYDESISTAILTGEMSNFLTNGITTPTVDTLTPNSIQYNNPMGSWEVTFNGTLLDDGNSDCTAGFVYRVQGEGEWTSWANCVGTYETGDNFSTTIYDTTYGETYEVMAVCENENYVGEGDIVEFTVEAEADIPEIETLSYPIIVVVDNASARIYGQVLWDGNTAGNVTGWFKYKKSTDSSWNDSSNTTDLITDSLFSANITSLDISAEYEYMAVGLNSEGYGYGAIASFTFYTVTAPTVETLPATLIKSTSAYLWGNVIDDGGDDNVWCRFQYRVSGTSTWLDTAGATIDEGDNFTQSVSGLTPSTNYEFRAVGRTNDPSYNFYYDYGEIRTFATYASITIPIISTDRVQYLSAGAVAVTASVVYDGGSDVTMYFQARENGYESWTTSEYTLSELNTGEEATWYISGLENGNTYDARAYGVNSQGTGYGNIITFVMSNTIDTDNTTGDDGGGGSGTGVSGFAELVKNIRESLGMTGAMGTWAFMALILVLVALIFAVAIVLCPTALLKTAVGVIWLLVSISVVGAFIFTGELGIWPIVILVFGVAFFIFILIGRVFSGGGTQNG